MKILHNQFPKLFITLCILLSACGPTPVPTQGPTVPSIPITTSDWLQVYFTDPTAPNAHEYNGGPDESLAAAIDAAHLTVDVAIYSLNLWSIRDALVQAERRGVTVRLVMESDNMDNAEVQDLLGAGIPVIGDQREGLMHDKFAIIDRAEVWTGSMNYTVSSAYLDNNNLIHISSAMVAEDYTNEFEKMFVQNLFGPEKPSGNPTPSLYITGTKVEIHFSPEDGVASRIIQLIQEAKQSIHFMAYSFTSNDIGNAIRDQAQAGLTVSGVMDEDQIQSNEGTEYDPFKMAGVDVRLDGIEGSMHHKVIIIDEKIVITGSYNFSNSAETENDENVVILYSPEVAAQYMSEFWRVYSLAQP